MRARNFPVFLAVMVLASILAGGCGVRQLTKSEMDRADGIAAKIARAESMAAIECAPRELAVAEAQLAHARHEAAEQHERAEEYFSEADRAADALLAKTIPCWEARQVKPAPPAPAAPTARLTADPGTIEKGTCSTLSWSTTGAEAASLDQGIGTVDPGGSREVCPPETIVYTITATGPGGSATASATVNVTQPPPAMVEMPAGFGNVHFDFDKSFIREDAKPILEAVAAHMKGHPGATLLIEGHCDERGTAEYNLALGERRANSAAKYLENLGVEAKRLSTISYGEERPEDPGHDEEAWAKNRRAVFVLR